MILFYFVYYSSKSLAMRQCFKLTVYLFNEGAFSRSHVPLHSKFSTGSALWEGEFSFHNNEIDKDNGDDERLILLA